MKEIVEYRKKNKNHSRKTIANRFSLKSVDNLNRITKYVEKNGNKKQKWDNIENYVIGKYRNARKN